MKLILNFIFGLYCLGRLVSMVPLHSSPMEDDTLVQPTAATPNTVATPVAAKTKGADEASFNIFNYAELIGVIILFVSMAMRKKRSQVVVKDPQAPTVVDTNPI